VQAKLHSAAILAQAGGKINCMNQHQNNVLLKKRGKVHTLYQTLIKVNSKCTAVYFIIVTPKTLLCQPPIQQNSLKNYKIPLVT
jgi:hypothetical protein